MIPRVFIALVALCALFFCSLAVSAGLQMPLSDVAHTSEGNFTVFHRTPADETDLNMPIFKQNEMGESMVYRVQDRKGRDLLFFARANLATKQPVDIVKSFYLNALGKQATQETDVKTGVVTLADGAKDHFRLVTITPTDGGCALRLEHIQHFTIPPRVYTVEETRIIHLLDEVYGVYSSARQISYTMEQRTQYPADETPQKAQRALSWSVVFTRPTQLHATASVDGTVGLEITTVKGMLKVHHQVGGDQERKITDHIVLDDLSEMQDDPVAGMMLGNSLVNNLLDTLHMQPVKGVPAGEQTEVILTYPDTNETLHLIIDLHKKQVLRSDTVTSEGGVSATTTRTYLTMEVKSPLAAAANITPKHKPKPRAIAATKGK